MNIADIERKFIKANLNLTKEVKINYPLPYEFDLFGETSITNDEVDFWMREVKGMDRSSPRFDWYIKNWDVVNKIKAVKQKYLSLDAYFDRERRLTAFY